MPYAVCQHTRTHSQAAAGREREGLPYVPCKEGVWAPQPALGAAALTHIHPCTAVALTGGAMRRITVSRFTRLLESVHFCLILFTFACVSGVCVICPSTPRHFQSHFTFFS